MLLTLAFRNLLVKPGRALVLLLGFGLGVGVMIVLLSVGEAMVNQSRDVSLVGGGEITVLPEGIDVEAMRTGGLSGMFFTIDRARFVTRQLLGGPRWSQEVRAVSPSLEHKLAYLSVNGSVVPVRAGGELPSRSAAVGAQFEVLSGSWTDTPADSTFAFPSATALYHELDRFHFNPTGDSTWAEWQYYNIEVAPEEWWYLTLLVGGQVPAGRWGGEVLITRRTPDGGYRQYTSMASPDRIRIDTTSADLTVGRGSVTQSGGIYHLRIEPVEGVSADLTIHPSANRYFPPVILRDDELISGYVVPALSATASGSICVADRCRTLDRVPAYHDHNWGVWRGVSWDWGSARGAEFNLLYGGVHAPDNGGPGGSSSFVALVDSLGVRQIFRAAGIRYAGSRAVPGLPGVVAPTGFSFEAVRDGDSVSVSARIADVHATGRPGVRGIVYFLQMRGNFTLKGWVGGQAITDSGSGFFETYVGREQH
ncbi:MAG: hypothetical protein ABI765_10850 [Gemmatimonadota bacterium]